MPELLLPYLISVVATLAVVLAALWAFIMSHRRAHDYARKEARLPLATRWEDLSERVADLQEEWDRLRDHLQQAKLIIEESQREREWLAQNKEEISQMRLERDQLERVRADLVQAQEEYAALRQALEQAELAKSKAEFSSQQLEERGRWLEEKLANQGHLVEQSESQLAELRTTINEITSQISEQKRQLAAYGEAIAIAQERTRAFEENVAKLKSECDALKGQKQELEQQAEKLRVAATQLREQAAQSEQRHKEYTTRNAELRDQQKRSDPSLMERDEVLAELWPPAVTLAEYTSAAKNETETAALERVSKYLDSLHLKFHRRTVFAFHTALKVARDTPLLVLAGISGTGKSLLPRRYAEALGMHFLGIPVQPRWDGPQDLLGFFNHLENRYKATELIRALVQFDEYNRDWLPKEYSGKANERMLLVLLDEMNLARIEYYFSEFLSRLEVRRDIHRTDNGTDRAKAEILLDVGRLREEVGCRIFVDTNVLFVGTMNEDESTLTLSDKVVDRANVMRFGRPLSLSRQQRNGQKPEMFRTKAFLSKTQWEGWLRKEEKWLGKEAVEQWISELNEALGQIGRPFGYRTRNAICSYVQQYPESPDRVRQAFADQIEQRVLPKLRGVDIQEDAGRRCLEIVQDVVGKAGDQELRAAIEEGARGHLFTWSGVDRSDETL